MKDIIQLKITLKHSKPEIWRRIQVTKETTLFELHHILQIVMGWQSYHLYEFNINKQRFGEPDNDFGDEGLIDSADITLEQVLTKPKLKFEYLYDFGDFWLHNIVFEKSIAGEKGTYYPLCIDGALSAPPEDCGGIGGFYYMLQVTNSKDHPEKEDMLEWMGADYDPNYFDKAAINEALGMLDEYMEDWLDDL